MFDKQLDERVSLADLIHGNFMLITLLAKQSSWKLIRRGEERRRDCSINTLSAPQTHWPSPALNLIRNSHGVLSV